MKLIEEIKTYLKELVSKKIGIKIHDNEIDTGFFELGLDSKMAMELVSVLEDKVEHELYPTLLFEYQNIEDLSSYLAENDADKFSEKDINKISNSKGFEANLGLVDNEETPVYNEESVFMNKLAETGEEEDIWGDLGSQSESKSKPVSNTETTIAIIGLSGRYPEAQNIDMFWERLKSGDDCISEIPIERWDLNKYFDEEKGKPGKSYSKWGGFIEDADKFDPLFFKMSPKAAENMDPQARIFLEESWKTVEDAGYDPGSLGKSHKVGVFAGVFWTDYQLFKLNNLKNSPSSFVSTVANMTSYYLGFSGPSMGVDTQCSSSLTALHLACESIKRGECEMAIAGGVNLSLHPSKYNWLSNAMFLSEKGKCESFGEGGEGYVPAEGVGAVLLKSLGEALKDGDQIYGLIRGSAINHGGRSSGLTVPNVHAQAQVIIEAMKNSNVKPEEISYIETHGTGTSLGDPIEVSGLTKAFESLEIKEHKCVLGSVKSNIGHAESAAGIAGITKILLQFKYKKLVPSLHSSVLNKNIDFGKTPFKVQQTFDDWTVDKGIKRIAGISSFGAGGSNAHILLEAYEQPLSMMKTVPQTLIVLSAKNKVALKNQASNLLSSLEDKEDNYMVRIAYTLQLGRQPMEERLAIVAENMSDIKLKLRNYLSNINKGLFSGNIQINKSDFILKGEAGKAYINTAIKERELESLAQLWTWGVEFNWEQLYSGIDKPIKISLPGYPFARERYWITENNSPITNQVNARTSLHPLLHQNESDFKEQKFMSLFTGDESFFKDHLVRDEKILPGVAYLELARAAGEYSMDKKILHLKDVSWLSPIKVNGHSEEVRISLFEDKGNIEYEIYSIQEEKKETIHGQGKLVASDVGKEEFLDIDIIKNALSDQKTGEECYKIFRELGFRYGESFRGIKNLYYGDNEALSLIELPLDSNYVLQPGIMDSALQTCLGISLAQRDMILSLPFSVSDIRIFDRLTSKCWCHVKKSSSQKDKVITYDIVITSASGKILVKLKGLVALPLKPEKERSFKDSNTSLVDTHPFTSKWQKSEASLPEEVFFTDYLIIVIGASPDYTEKLTNILTQEVIGLPETNEIDFYSKVQELVQTKLLSRKPIHISIVYKNENLCDYGFISGLLKTAQMESPKIVGKLIGVDTISISAIEELSNIIKKEQLQKRSLEVSYREGERYERKLYSLPLEENSEAFIKNDGVYLITGGAGGLGKIFAKHLTENKDTKLIITGRSKDCRLDVKTLNSLNATYYSCDVSNKKAVSQLIDHILETYGKLNGIVHSAGIIRDSFLVKKDIKDAITVLQPKISGVKYLDHFTQDLGLDYFVLFSSMSGVTGNLGQADYASANAWLDYFAFHRNNLVKQGKRKGHTLSIDWPLWENGGMQMDDQSLQYVEQKWGMKPLPTYSGLKVFESLLKNKITQGIITYGNAEKISSILLGRTKEETSIPIISNSENGQEATIEKTVISLISTIVKLDTDRINKNKAFGDYGFDSIMMTDFARLINEKYEGMDLAPTTLINYPSIAELVEHLIQDYSHVIEKSHPETKISKPEAKAATREQKQEPINTLIGISKRKRFIDKRGLSLTKRNDLDTMAIVAMSGKFSEVLTEEELWERSLSNQRLIINTNDNTNVGYSGLPLKSNVSWKMLGIDTSEFEQLSFQEKLIFEALATALKHYKIDKDDLSLQSTGVFIAAQEFKSKDAYGSKGNQSLAYLIPNKLSYHLNLRGPSEIINTYCTSSYVAIHRAIQSISRGECEQAIVGGINLISEQDMNTALSSDFDGLFSREGFTGSFNENATGFVRSEGVGILVIKPLEAAEEFRNQILGVIKGSSVYHGGKGFSLEAPNARGLKKAIEDSLLKASVPVDTIDYIEAHGIANRMADAIELSALDEVYKKHSKNPDKKWHIGSIKPIIGHSELASGIASIIKVLKAFEHKTIPGIAGLDRINTELSPDHSLILSEKSFYWKNGKNPRRAALNSYAVGGVNAHLILEEYNGKQPFVKDEHHFDKLEPANIDTEESLKHKTLEKPASDKIKAIAQEVFNIDKNDFNELISPMDYGFDSIKVIEFVRTVNERFEVDIKLGQILGADNFKNMFEVISKTVSVSSIDTLDTSDVSLSTIKKQPLSEGQKGLWFIQESDPNSSIYNIPVGFALKENIKEADIYNVIRKLLSVNPLLRVVFKMEEGGDISQQVLEIEKFLDEDVYKFVKPKDINKILNELKSIPFNLSEKAFRLHLIKDETNNITHILFVIHHIIFDGTSVNTFVSQFLKLIHGSIVGLRMENPEIDTTYFDFVEWEQDYLKGTQANKDLKYWNGKLNASTEILALPYDNINGTRELESNLHGSCQKILDPALTLKIKDLARELKVSTSIIMLSFFKLLLARLSNSSEVTLTMPTSGRTKSVFSNSMGYFINMMISQATLNKEESFTTFVKRIYETFLVNMDHIQYPFPKLLTELHITKENQNINQVSYVYQNIFSTEILNNTNDKIEFISDLRQDSINEYSLEVIDRKDSLELHLKFRKDLFKEETVQRHLKYYSNIVEALIKNPKEKPGNIQILPLEEEHKLLKDFNNTTVAYPREMTIDQLFEKQALTTPNQIAVSFEDENISYQELNKRSSQFAGYLQNQGIESNTLVGICMSRSIQMIISIVGVLRAGGAYVPIDPSYPQQRIEYIIRDSIIKGNGKSGFKLIITGETQSETIKQVVDGMGVNQLCLTKKWFKQNIEDNPEYVLRKRANAEDPAYIMYTSGSTGKPKGVVIPHRGVVRLVKNTNHHKYSIDDVLLSTGSFSFDATIFEFFGMLLNGGTLILVPKEILLNSQLLIQAVDKYKVNFMFFTTGWLNQLIDEELQLFSRLKKVVTGGERISPIHIDKLRKSNKNLEIVNAYGPTENASFSLTYNIIEVKGDIPVGCPINNSTAYVLNNELMLQPVGVSGELCVAGDGLATGYLNRPELTNEKFVDNPFGTGKLYRTGDLVRWLPDGNIEFLGRIDDQIKLRGFRIELGEIESVLNDFPTIKNSVVVVKEHGGSRQLVAYITVIKGKTVQLPDLKSYLTERLPDYMIPAFIVDIEEIPLTTNGKADRKNLMNRNIELVSVNEFQAPKTNTEKLLAEIWMELLQVERVGLRDNFFELGGHSLLITKLVSRIQQKTGHNPRISTLFKTPVLIDMAAVLEGEQEKQLAPIKVLKKRTKISLSNAQKRLWFLDEMGQGSSYHVPMIIRVKTKLDIEVLDKCLSYLVTRHEILRTTFQKNTKGKLYQEINNDVNHSTVKKDYSQLGGDNLEKAVYKSCMEFIHEDFDLITGPLFRTLVIKEAEKSYVFGICMHHIISDGWSLNILINELNILYKGFKEGTNTELSKLKIQYVDYTVWSKKLLKNKDYKARLSEVITHLEGYEDFSMTTDFKRPKVVSGKGKRIVYTLENFRKDKLQKYSMSMGGTLFTGFLASVFIALNKFSGKEDICIGVPVANRSHPDVEELIGFFVNTLVNRLRCKENDTLNEVFVNVQSELIRSQMYQDIPFDNLIEVLHPQRDRSITPVFQVMVNYVSLSEKLDFGGITEELDGLEYYTSKFDLTVNFIETRGDDIELSLEYNTDIYNENTARRLMEAIVNCIDNIPHLGMLSLSDYSLLSNIEENKLLNEFNNTSVAYPRDMTIHELFEKQALITPNQIAVSFNDEVLTYKELEKRSAKLAAYLQHIGVTPSTLVGVCMDRSLEMMVSIMGILRAGGAYVPIDSNYPEHRIEYIIKDSILKGNESNECKIIISGSVQREIIKSLVTGDKVQLLCYDEKGSINKVKENQNVVLKKAGTAGDVAYIMYTSGSTGKPKGVMIPHRGVVRLVKNTNYHRFTEDDILLSTGSFSFDASTFEFFGMLLNGGTLVLVPQKILLNSQKLASEIRKNKVNLMWFTSSWLNQLIDENIKIFKNLRKVICGGERLSLVHIKKLRETYPRLEITNGYGPTENTTFSLTYEIKEVGNEIPIGIPLNNTQVYIVDKKNIQLQPIGVAGELCLAGDGLAIGYLNRPELSNEKFIENPFGHKKLYRTGDLARWLPDGTVEFLGRLDRQVKLRGFRIELGEIEAVLNRYPEIVNSTVIVKEHLGERHLVAFIVTEDEQKSDFLEVKSYLMELLPHYMIPSFFIEIETIPLTSNGKVDKDNLKSRELDLGNLYEYIPPITETEKQLALLWQDVLGVEQVGLNHNFFELGGHSLLITKLLSRILVQFNVSLPMSAIFEASTLKNLARIIEESFITEKVKKDTINIAEVIPLSSSQQRLWFLSEMGQGDRYHIPGLLRIMGELNIDNLGKSLNYLLKRHDVLRTTFKKKGEEVYQHIDHHAEIKLITEDFSSFSDNEREKLYKKRCRAFNHESFDLYNGPLIRVLIIKMKDKEFILCMCMHHIISDGWSLGIMNHELNVIYSAIQKGIEPNLDPLPIQYSDYSIRQHEMFKSEKFQEGLNYWVTHLKGYKNLSLPTDFPRPKTSSGKGGRLSIELDGAYKNALMKFSLESKGTLFTSLLSCVYILLHKYSGQKDFCIGVPTANRGEVDIEGLIGFFVNTMASRIQMDSNDTLLDIFKKVQKELMYNQQFQFVPFDKVVESVQSGRDLSRTPIFQVMVNYANVEGALALGDTKAVQEELLYNTSKFDLSFDFENNLKGGLNLFIEFNTDIYTSHTINRMLKSMDILLRSLPGKSDKLVSTFDILTSNEKKLLLNDFNATKNRYNKNLSIPKLIENQTNKSPDKIALAYEKNKTTYKSLNEEANRLANFLRKKYDIKKGDFVGVKLQRNECLIITLLAVLKCGAVYVPIDINYPKKRIKYIEKDSNVKLIIDSNYYAAFVKQNHRFSKNNPRVKIDSNSLAYIIYTSGTTGNPKGVMITHKNVLAMISWAADTYNLLDIEVVFATTSHCFDLSVFEMFYTLSSGKTIRILKNALGIKNYLKTEKKILINTVPSSMRSLLEDDCDLSNVKAINLAGEPFPVDIAERLQDRGITIHNLYGPSEDTTYSTFYKIEDGINYHSIPIGKPISNTKAYVFDEHMQLMPFGAQGRLFLSGDGVTMGYLNKPELTNQRFVPNPFVANELMYDTGDLAKWSVNGNLEYLGRLDNQVKVRGFRIELGEIENRLNDHQEVHESAVIVNKNNDNDQLVAFCSMKDSFELSPEKIKSWLQKFIPDYMVPTFIIEVDEIPLTPNGKIDRKKLAELEFEVKSGEKYLDPETDIEKKMAVLWEEILQVKGIGLYSDFFEMGGHSLMVTKLITRIESNFGVALSVPVVFENSTLVSLSERVSEKSDISNLSVTNIQLPSHLVVFNQTSKNGKYDIDTFIIPGMPGLADGYYDLAEQLFDRSNRVYGIQMKGALEGESPAKTFKEMANHNINQIQEVRSKKIRLIAHSYGGRVLYEMLKTWPTRAPEIEQIILLDCYAFKSKLKVIEKIEGFLLAVPELLKVSLDAGEAAEIAKKLIRRPLKLRKKILYNILVEKGGKIDEKFFNSLYAIYNVSMGLGTIYKSKIERKIVLIKSKQTFSEKEKLGWEPYYKSIKVIESTGNHFEVARRPFVNEWIKILKN